MGIRKHEELLSSATRGETNMNQTREALNSCGSHVMTAASAPPPKAATQITSVAPIPPHVNSLFYRFLWVPFERQPLFLIETMANVELAEPGPAPRRPSPSFPRSTHIRSGQGRAPRRRVEPSFVRCRISCDSHQSHWAHEWYCPRQTYNLLGDAALVVGHW